jgi:peptidoglycan/xylan/chitin deacetylase (PgdA/CDA1 family)
MKSILFALAGIVFSFSTKAQTYFSNYRIADWSGNKKAVAVITFDDNCPGQFNFALPALEARNLKSTFFIITQANQCGPVDWAKVDSAFAKGHEIGSHSVNHINMANSDSLTIENELFGSYQFLQNRYYPQGWKITLAYPFGRGGGSSAQDKRIRRIASKYYYAGRSAGVGPAGFTGYHDYVNTFYDRFYMQWGTYLMGPGNVPSPSTFSSVLDSCVKRGGIFTCLYHGIETGGFNNVPSSVFASQLDTLKSRQNRIWITTFGKAIQYHAERRAEAVLEETFVENQTHPLGISKRIKLKCKDTLTGAWFREPLTFRIPKSALQLAGFGFDSLKGVSNFLVDGDSIQFDLVPGDSVVADVVFVSSKSKISDNGRLKIWPNPLKDQTLELECDLSGNPEKEVEWSLLDFSGRYLAYRQFLQVKKKGSLDLPELSPGFYTLLISDRSQGLVWKEKLLKY